MSIPLILLQKVSHAFGPQQALKDLDLSIASGERVALLGASGSGKTTLLRILNGTLRPTQGSVWFNSVDLTQLRPPALRAAQSKIGMVYQHYHLIESLRVIHNVNCGHLGRWPWWKAALSLIWPQEISRAQKALAQVGIAEKLLARTDQLSGGQRQRVALARVLVQDPLLILGDEPISNLDPELSQTVMDLLRMCNEQQGKTLILSLHNPDYALSHCTRILGLRQGRIVLDTQPQAVTPQQLTDLYRCD